MEQKYKVLGIDQDNNIFWFEDAKIKTILKETGYNSAKPIYKDVGDKSIKTGYYLTNKGYEALWINLYNITDYFK